MSTTFPTVMTRFKSFPHAWRLLARKTLLLRNIPKTLVFNFRYLPLREAVHLPVLVSHRVDFLGFGGTVTVRGPSRRFGVRLGFGDLGRSDFMRARSVWYVTGSVTFDGPVALGQGFKLLATGHVSFGEDFILQAESEIICCDRVTFGNGSMVGWHVLIMDSDYHPIVSEDGKVPAVSAPIVFGERVWVCARATVLKGVEIGSDAVVAAGAVVTGREFPPNVVLAGNPARVVRTGIHWSR